MTNLFGGRLRAALGCGVATGALFAVAGAQETVDDATTAPLSTSAVGAVTVTGDGRITLPSGTAITIDSDDDVTLDGTLILDGEEDGAVGILVTGERAANVSGVGAISITSAVETDTDEAPASFPGGRFGLLIAEDARLTGDVTFAAGSTIAVDTDGGAGIGVLGALDGDLGVASAITVEGNGADGLRVAGPVTGDVVIASVDQPSSGAAPAIEARGLGANAVVIEGDVDGGLSVARTLRAQVFTTGLVGDGRTFGTGDDPDPDTPLTDEQQAALVGGNALRVTGDVAGGIRLAAQAAAVTATEDAPAVPAQTGAVLQSEGAPAALYVGGGAQVGALDGDFGGFGLFNGGVIAGSGGVIGASNRGVLIEDASVAGGLRNARGATIRSEARGIGVGAVAVEFAADAALGRVLNEGTIIAEVQSDTGDAVAFVDRSGTVARFDNEGVIEADLSDFDDGDADTDGDAEGPAGAAVAVDLSAASGGVAVANAGLIAGAVRLGEGDDTVTVTGLMDGAVSLGGGDDTLVLDGGPRAFGERSGFLTGNLDTGDGDDSVTVTGGGFAGDLVLERIVVANTIDLGGGRDAFTVTGEDTRVVSILDFGEGEGEGEGGDGGGGTFALTDGARFDGTIANAGDVDVTIGPGGSRLRLFADRTEVGSLTTLAGEEGRDGAVIVFDVDVDGETVAAFDVAGDAVIADDTTFETVFRAAFADDLTTAIITAGGDLDIDLDIDRLNATGAAPFLFSQSLSLSDDGRSLRLNLERRSAEEIGLDPVAAAAYEPLIAALVAANEAIPEAEGVTAQDADTAIGAALFNLGAVGTEGESGFVSAQERFFDAYDQFLPGPLDAPLTYARTQTNSVTSLVAQRVTGLRDGTDRRRNAWLQESSYFVKRDTDGGARGYDGGGFVIALGLDAPLGPIDTVGISGSVASARYDEEAGEDFPYDRLTYSVGAYAADRIGDVHLDGRVSYGWASSESERNLVINALDPETGRATGEGDVRRTAQGEWDGTQVSAHGRVLYAGRMGAWDVQPFASLDYLNLDEDAYAETGDAVRAIAFEVDAREATSLRGNVGVVLGREFKTRPSRFDTSIPATIAPRVTLAYTDELDSGDLEATYRFQNGEDFVLSQEKPGGAAILGADVAYENEYARLGLGGSVTASEEAQIYTLRVGVGLKW